MSARRGSTEGPRFRTPKAKPVEYPYVSSDISGTPSQLTSSRVNVNVRSTDARRSHFFPNVAFSLVSIQLFTKSRETSPHAFCQHRRNAYGPLSARDTESCLTSAPSSSSATSPRSQAWRARMYGLSQRKEQVRRRGKQPSEYSQPRPAHPALVFPPGPG